MADVTLTQADLAALLKNLAHDVREYVGHRTGPLRDEQTKFATTLDTLATICEQVPQRLEAIEQRVRALEGGQHG